MRHAGREGKGEKSGPSSMEGEAGRPRAVFMAFGTKGDVYPIAVTLPLGFFLEGKKKSLGFVLGPLVASSEGRGGGGGEGRNGLGLA